jgi:cation/acetate symporter
MSNAIYARIRENPKFQQLVTQRSRFAWLLSAIVLILFYGLVLIVAFKPALIGERIADGSSLTVGVAAGLFMFVFFWLLTALYVRRANTAFDALTAELIKDATKETK